MKLLEKLFCKHEYKETGNQLIDTGRNKIFYLKCKKCGRETVAFLESHKKWDRGKFGAI